MKHGLLHAHLQICTCKQTDLACPVSIDEPYTALLALMCMPCSICNKAGQTIAGSVHLYYHPEWPDIKLAQAALLCGQAADMITAEGLQVDDVPVMLGGDWNSLWRKYRPDVYDTQVRPTCLCGWCIACCSVCTHKLKLHNPSCCCSLFGSRLDCGCFSARLKPDAAGQV